MINTGAKQQIYATLRAIPTGKVTSYGQVAEFAGLPRAARLVGTVLSQLPKDSTLSWHRVIRASGQIAFPTDSPRFQKQWALLQQENIEVINGTIRLRQFGWQP